MSSPTLLAPEGDDEPPSRPSLGATVLGWLRGLGGRREGDLRDSLEDLIDDRENPTQPIEPDERLMLKNILKLGEIHADDVMVPRADILAVDVDTGLEALVAVFWRASRSRLLVFSGTLDTVLGMAHIKDLPAYWDGSGDFSLRRHVREVLFVPPSMRAMDLLQKMREGRVHMAVVVDEFGGTDGLVTIEDLVEEIVGEIEDEHDRDLTPALTANPDGSFQADGRVPVEALETKAGLALLSDEADEEIETLGGLVFSLVGRVPRSGDRIAHPCGIEFEVLDADPRRIKRLKIRMPRLVDEEGAGTREPGAETGTRGPLAEK